jgi:hypothetical protein
MTALFVNQVSGSSIRSGALMGLPPPFLVPLRIPLPNKGIIEPDIALDGTRLLAAN